MPVDADRRRPVTAEARYRPCATVKLAHLTPQSQLPRRRKSGGFSPSYDTDDWLGLGVNRANLRNPSVIDLPLITATPLIWRTDQAGLAARVEGCDYKLILLY